MMENRGANRTDVVKTARRSAQGAEDLMDEVGNKVYHPVSLSDFVHHVCGVSHVLIARILAERGPWLKVHWIDIGPLNRSEAFLSHLQT